MLQLQIYDPVNLSWLNAYHAKDEEIEIEEYSPVWDTSPGTFSHPFKLPVEQNRHILGNIDSLRGEDIYTTLYGRRFRLYANGILFRSGIIRMDTSVQIEDGAVEIELASNMQELSEMLEGISCQDVDVRSDSIQIGYSFPEKLSATFGVTCTDYNLGVIGRYNISKDTTVYVPKIMVPNYHDTQHDGQFTRDFTNIQYPYEPSNPKLHPFCNVRVCYQKYEKKNGSWEAKHGYSIGEHDRVNSAPCFYVMYVLQKLFSMKDIHVSENVMNDWEDMRRLAFFHTNCEYDEVNVSGYFFSKNNADNKVTIDWKLSSNGQIEVYYLNSSVLRRVYFFDKNASFVTRNSDLCRAFATSKNLPDTDVMDVIESLQNAFLLRFMFDSNCQTMRVKLVKDILEQSGCTALNAEIYEVDIEEYHKLGYRLKYSSANTVTENALTHQKTSAVDSEETSYNYYDKRYATLFNQNMATTGINEYPARVAAINPYDTTYYVDCNTGNGFRIKVDSNADSEEKELYPSLFEVGGFRDVEYGDCSDNDFVEEVSIGFEPVVENDINGDKLMFADVQSGISPKLAQFVDVEIHHKDDDSLIETKEKFTKTIFQEQSQQFSYVKPVTKSFKANVIFKMKAVESYEISSGGKNPYDEQTPEFKLGIMRGSGSDAHVVYYDENYDSEGNNKWESVAGSDSAFTSDSVDQYGSSYDYNGASEPGLGGDERISLKLKAEKTIRGDKENGYYPVTGTACAHRGLFDKFHETYAYWVTHRKLAKIVAKMELADIVNIDFTKKYRIGEYTGFIKTIKYSLSSDGVSPVTVELYYL